MNISDEIISVEEARAALRCMRLCNLDEQESLESIDSLVHRIRKIGTAKLVDEIIENRLSETQRKFVKEYWFSQKNTAQIARESGVSQANVYRTLTRANETIKDLLTPLVVYYNDLPDMKVVPLYVKEIMQICSAKGSGETTLSAKLKNIRLSNAVTPEQASRVMCITAKELDDVENGRKEPTVELLRKYSKAFGLEINLKLVNGKERYEWKEA